MKIVASKTKPPFASLVLAQLARLDTEWGAETCLEVKEGGICLKGDASIARYLAQSNPHLHLQGDNIQCKTEVDHWISFVIGPLACENEFEKAIQYLDQVLLTLTHLVGDRFTVADFVVFGGLYFNGFWQNLLQQGSAPTNVLRWFHLVASHEPVKAVLSTLPKESHVKPMSQVPKKEPARTGEPKKVKDEGKFVDLPGAEMGKVVVRFPPEASGYLHIGHAKAALLNQHYKDHFQGKLIMRFDDTNPAKEKEEYEHVILEDLKMLNVRYDYLSRTSDHFSTILNYCEKLLKEGKAYVDDTDADTMKKEREARQESKNRDNSVATNLSLWEEMKKGSAKGLTCAVRAKMDMKSDNGCMRDPTIYRCKLESHPATKEQFKVYPTYDFACPIVDSIEGVTHALRTTEYMDRDEQFYWFIDALGLRKPVIYAYARLNLTNTVMSKRKLTWFVESGTVDGWDDPRFPTVRGVLRRGLTVEALKQFILAQGSSRSVVFMKWDKIWAMNKKVLDPIAPRYTTIEEKDHVEVHIDGVAAEEAFLADAHPKDASVGKKVVWRTPRVLIDGVDAQTLKEGENATFINWGNITISKLHREHGKVVKVEAKANFDDKDFKKTLKVTWLGLTQAPEGQFIPAVCIYYDHIISKEVLDKEDDFKNFIGHNTKTEVAMLGDPELSKLKKGDIIQIQRRGFFIVDAAYKGPSVHSCKPSPIRLIAIPDGSSGSYGCPISQANSTATVSEPKPSLDTKGGDSKPSQSNKKAKCPSVTQDVATVAAANDKNSAQLHQEIVSVGNKVRELKASKADKAQISEQVAQLLHLKAQFKTVTGTEWKPEDAKPSAPPSSAASSEVPNAELSKQLADDITAQGNKVRQLKADKADKAAIDTAVHVLLGLKTKYKTLTGQDWQPPSDKGPSKKEAKGQPKAEKKPQSSAQTKSQPTPKVKPEVADAGGLQKQTRLGMEARKEDNLADWYSQVITKAELLEYYDVSGCYILRPWAFSIWEKIQHFFDGEIKKLGVQNCYFPMFVSQAALQREKDHIADFAPEVAWVTKSGDSELAEPIAIRPTSETVMYPAYAKWVQSYRDLPIKLNQWNNVVRWEFKHPQPFLRTREFLWQEGHTAFANQQEAKEEVMIILDLYRQVYEDLLAIPVIRGRKTEKEKFAGGDYTTTVEAYISSAGRAIQGATSHHLGQNFSKMFEIVYDHPETGDKCYVYQNSWGITTRTLGVLTMVHGDNKGLVLPPNVAQIQVVIVACGITVQLKEQDKNELYSKCKEYEEALKAKSVRVMGDYRENYSPGWKFNHWELKGVPIRVEIGPRDIKSGQYVAVRRDTGEKLTMKKDSCQKDIPALLDSIQASLFNKAKEDLNKNLVVVKEWSDFLAALDQNKLIQAPFCGQVACEDQIKDMSKADADLEPGAPSMGAKSLCIPFSQPAQITPDLKCIGPRCQQSPQAYTLFGRSY